MDKQQISALILAAGKGTRMKSNLPKVLQALGGRPLITHLLDTLKNMEIEKISVIYGYLGEMLKNQISSKYNNLTWIEQIEQLGTGHAVKIALPYLKEDEYSLILLGDTPLIKAETLENLIKTAEKSGVALLTAKLDNPFGYGRIIRNNDNVIAIIEEKDLQEEQKKITEINTGVMIIKNEYLFKYLPEINNNNKSGEYYITDLIGLFNKNNIAVAAFIAEDKEEVLGINNKLQLAIAEKKFRKNKALDLLTQGATLIDPERVDVYGEVSLGSDVIIEPNVFFKGKVKLGNNVYIESGCILKDCVIGSNSTIYANSIIENSQIYENVSIGPFARIRPNSVLKNKAKVGNFVEIKAGTVGENSKVNHLSYIGDSELGENVNIGAGTITCNYDGANKFKTVIGNNVFVGSNSALVAPVNLADNSTIGAGSVITTNITENTLAFTRAELKQKSNWQRPSKNKGDKK